MSDISLKLTYGLKNGIIKHISEVESGLVCGCVCPACGDRLIAKKGAVVKHHFAHQAKEPCEYGLETALHLAAKEIIASAKEMIIPQVRVVFPQGCKHSVLIHESMMVKLDHVELEKRFDNIIPDIAVYSGNKKFLLSYSLLMRLTKGNLKK